MFYILLKKYKNTFYGPTSKLGMIVCSYLCTQEAKAGWS